MTAKELIRSLRNALFAINYYTAILAYRQKAFLYGSGTPPCRISSSPSDVGDAGDAERPLISAFRRATIPSSVLLPKQQCLWEKGEARLPPGRSDKLCGGVS